MKWRFFFLGIAIGANGPIFAAAPKVDIGGIVKIDQVMFSEKSLPPEPENHFYNGAYLASAFLMIDVEYSPNLSFYTELDMDGGNLGLAYLELSEIVGSGSSLMLGAVPSPFCLEMSNSSKSLPFLYRSLATSAFAPCSGPGANFRLWGEHYVLNAAATQLGVGEDSSTQRDDPWGGSARFLIKPIANSEHLVHLGGSVSYQTQKDEISFKASEIKGRKIPALIGTSLDNDGGIENGKDYAVLGVEAAARFGSLQVESDYLLTQVRREGADKLSFSGWSAQGNYFITGEQRAYNIETGSFQGPMEILKPAVGAWQVALRASQINLNDLDIEGGRELNSSFAVNWYVNTYVRVTANLIHQQIWPFASAPQRTVDALGLRLQTVW